MSFKKNVLCGLVLVAMHSGRMCGAENVTYAGKVRSILKVRCFKCHSDDEQKSDLNLQHYASVLKGGSGGPAVLPGKPNSSLLYQSVMHAEGVEKMPPKSERIPDEELEWIRVWIAAGAPEDDGGVVRSVVPMEIGPIEPTRPQIPVMPESGLNPPGEIVAYNPHPVTALAISPWAPLIAQAKRDAIALRHADDGRILTWIPFPEGVPFVLRFSNDGARLFAAGGDPVRSGRAVVFDVRTGARLGQWGDENDAVMAADWSPNGKWIAIGGSGKMVKVFDASTGLELYRIRKHTDWVTAVAFSPDGSLLATGDRAGGIHLWDAGAGGIALSLSEHKDAIHSLEWRRDSRLLASASEDGSVIVWDAKDGWPAATISKAHPVSAGSYAKNKRAGVLAAVWLLDGHLATAGRDRRVRFWKGGGEPTGVGDEIRGLPTRLRAGALQDVLWMGDDGGRLYRVGVHGGEVRIEDFERLE
jgi:hypothetical protein